jgi:flagellar biosynthesis component FlhA
MDIVNSFAKGIADYGVPFLFSLYIAGSIWFISKLQDKVDKTNSDVIEANKQLHLLEKDYRKEQEIKDARHAEKIETMITAHMRTIEATEQSQQNIIKLLEEIRKRRT